MRHGPARVLLVMAVLIALPLVILVGLIVGPVIALAWLRQDVLRWRP